MAIATILLTFLGVFVGAMSALIAVKQFQEELPMKGRY